MRKLKTVLVPFLLGRTIPRCNGGYRTCRLINKRRICLSFDQFTAFSWNIFAMELVGTAVFVFGIAAVLCSAKKSKQLVKLLELA
ncbi:hypothetical protein KOY49_03280 [Candidatus Minimicrobia vallesae]|uniref:Uncharacterized protein n=1 Tax=Candidatus Minimicrobia vallesae TaxID=2841264 RepID=A0A8F1SA40_9BACT|nr:hypothetical protein KOY49_03280 [Candidatus Minimicrobia vallesae]